MNFFPILLRSGLLSALLMLMYGNASAQGTDVKGSKDHPVVSRFVGSYIRFYDSKEYNSYNLRLGAIAQKGAKPANELSLEGKVTRILYLAPKNSSTFEIIRNYENALKAGGFQGLFNCSLGDCGQGFSASYPSDNNPHISGFTKEQRYYAAKRAEQDKTIYAAVFVVETGDGPFIRLDVVETTPMATDKVSVTAAQINTDITSMGKAIIYAFYFDTGKSELKPESDAALGEVAQWLKDHPGVNLFVVGHTDNSGGLAVNQSLSEQRAAAVVQALEQRFGVPTGRLIAKGVAYLCPIASNSTEAGKTQNRRVELVPQ